MFAAIAIILNTVDLVDLVDPVFVKGEEAKRYTGANMTLLRGN